LLVYIYRFSYPILIPSLLKNRGLEFRRFTHNGIININISEHNHHTQHTHMHHTHMHHTHTTQINVIYIYRQTRTEMKCAKKVLLFIEELFQFHYSICNCNWNYIWYWVHPRRRISDQLLNRAPNYCIMYGLDLSADIQTSIKRTPRKYA
jgi:hypothetical protein